MANRPKRRPEKDARLLGLLRSGAGIIEACRRAGYRYHTVKGWRRNDPVLESAITEAIEEGEEARLEKFERRGVEGWLEPVFHRGHVVGHVQRHSDVAAIFSFKARNPRRFNDKLQVEHQGAGGGPLQVVQKVYQVQSSGTPPSAPAPGNVPSPDSDQPQDEPPPWEEPVTVKRRDFV